jgi:hypothetical protein
MPLIKVKRHGFWFTEMTAAPKEAELNELPEARRDQIMSEEAHRTSLAAAARRERKPTVQPEEGI